jgi:hypothetical protein
MYVVPEPNKPILEKKKKKLKLTNVVKQVM